MNIAVSSVKSEYSLSDRFASEDLRSILGDQKENIDMWKEVVNSEFDRVWARTLVESTPRNTVAKTDAPTLEVRNEENELNIQNELGEEKELDEEELDQDAAHEKELIRTCTTTLKSIIRPDIEANEQFVSILNRRQLELTDLISDLSVLTYKTVLAIAAGDLYDDSLGQRSSDSFDIRSILPDNFKFRCDVDPILRVVPIPPNLQNHLESALENSSRDDFTQLLSQSHLQFIHTEFLSSYTRKKKVEGSDTKDIKHPVWQRAADAIWTSDTDNLTCSPTGISHTITEQIRQFSTSVSNLWHGSILNKSMEYLLRILLRLHLAPERERRFKEGARLACERKKAMVKKPTTISKTLWNRKTLLLCDELAMVHQGKRNDKFTRIQAILGTLLKLHSIKPTSQEIHLPCIDEQLSCEADPEECTTMTSSEALLLEDFMICNNGLLKGDDADMDDFELEADLELTIQDSKDDKDTKEPPAARLKTLQAILKMLLESPNIHDVIDANWVRKSSH
ncbi:hypothetical protein BGZ76_005978, partial [Entomortierella beljakovae]